MIVLDTHIWVWWVTDSEGFTPRYRELIETHQVRGLGVSIFSCWEVAKLVEKGRLTLSLPVEEWLNTALAYPGIQLLNLSVPIIVQATQLPGFHKDPAAQIIVATAKVHDFPVLTADKKILDYPQVLTLS